MKKFIYSMLMMAVAAFAFTSCEDVPMPYDNPNNNSTGGDEDPVVEIVGDGTVDNPYNVVSALQIITSGEAPAENVYVKGVISQIDQVDTSYGNATYYISDDGTTDNQLEVYRGYSFNGNKFTSEDAIKVGDKIVVYGQIVYYNNKTPEFTQGSQIYELNGEKGATQKEGTPTGSGTQADPYNATAANKYIATLGADTESTSDIYIKGKVASVKDEFTTNYGNASFYISDDGTEESETFYVYRTLYLGNEKYTSGDQIKVGDEVIICGKVVYYKGNTPETVQNQSYIYSLNGKTQGSGGSGGETSDVKTVSIADFNAAAESTDVWYQLTGTVKNLKDGDQYGNFDLEDATGSVYVYGLLSEKGGEKKKFQDLAAAKGIKNGSKITIIGNRGSYNGKIEVMNAYFVSIEDSGEGGGETSNTGTEASPLTASQAHDIVAAMDADKTSDVDYYVKGKISSIKYTFSAQYGTATFNISNDGKEDSKQFIAYSCYYFDNKAWVEGNTQVAVGDEVVVCGKVINYKGSTPEFASKKNWLISLNGSTK